MKPTRRNRRPTEPGLILRKYYLEPRGLSIARFAEAACVTRKHVSSIVNGRAAITPDMAVRIASVLETTPTYWMNLQNAISLYDAGRELATWRPKEVHSAHSLRERPRRTIPTQT